MTEIHIRRWLKTDERKINNESELNETWTIKKEEIKE